MEDEELRRQMMGKMGLFSEEIQHASKKVFGEEIGFLLLASPFGHGAGYAGIMGNMPDQINMELLQINLARLEAKQETE